MSEVVTLVLAGGFVVIGFAVAASVVREDGAALDEDEAPGAPEDAPATQAGTPPADSAGRPRRYGAARR